MQFCLFPKDSSLLTRDFSTFSESTEINSSDVIIIGSQTKSLSVIAATISFVLESSFYNLSAVLL